MARIIKHSTEAVTLGVLDKNLAAHSDLQQVTFEDVHGTLHTVQAHKQGPFSDPEAIVQAFYDGTLHPHESHEIAAVLEEQRGNSAEAERLRALSTTGDPQAHDDQGGRY